MKNRIVSDYANSVYWYIDKKNIQFSYRIYGIKRNINKFRDVIWDEYGKLWEK